MSGDIVHIVRIAVQGGVSGDLRQRRRPRTQHGRPGGHGLQDREPEPLIQRGEDEGGGAPVQDRQLFIAGDTHGHHVLHRVLVRAQHLCRGAADHQLVAGVEALLGQPEGLQKTPEVPALIIGAREQDKPPRDPQTRQ